MDAHWTTLILMTGHMKCCLSWSLKKRKNKEKGCSSNRNKGWEYLTSQASPSQGTRASLEAVNPETQVGQNHKSTSALAWVSSRSLAKDFKQRCDIITFFPPKNKDTYAVLMVQLIFSTNSSQWVSKNRNLLDYSTLFTVSVHYPAHNRHLLTFVE